MYLLSVTYCEGRRKTLKNITIFNTYYTPTEQNTENTIFSFIKTGW